MPSAVDWDGDGRIDIVSGNAYGNILFFRNVGTNRLPAWLPGEPLRAGGVTIQVGGWLHREHPGCLPPILVGCTSPTARRVRRLPLY